MARHPEGWTIFRRKGELTYTVRFSHNGRRVERSTGSRDPGEAKEAAARIYADHVQREPEQRPAVRRGDSPPLEELVALWLATDSTISPRTVPIWTVYGGHWREHWESLVHVTDATIKAYRNARLTRVMAATVRKELSALRRFLEWCRDNGHLERDVHVCSVPAKATGRRFEKRRRKAAPELSPEEVEAIIERLPEWSAMGGIKREPHRAKKRFPVRARFIVAYETGLRPSLLDELRVPDHYTRGASELVIFAEVDKNRYERRVPLTQRAREALDSVCPDIGPIFGKHDYRIPLRRAAEAVLPRAKAAIFTGAHFRSAQATHTLELTDNLPGTMHLFGWKLVSTASRYTRPSERAAEAVISAREQARQRQVGRKDSA